MSTAVFSGNSIKMPFVYTATECILYRYPFGFFEISRMIQRFLPSIDIILNTASGHFPNDFFFRYNCRKRASKHVDFYAFFFLFYRSKQTGNNTHGRETISWWRWFIHKLRVINILFHLSFLGFHPAIHPISYIRIFFPFSPFIHLFTTLLFFFLTNISLTTRTSQMLVSSIDSKIIK